MSTLILSFLPYFCLLLTILFFFCIRDLRDYRIYESIILGSIVWSLAIWIQSYSLSIFSLIKYECILLFWIVYFAVILFLIFKYKFYNFIKFKKIPLFFLFVFSTILFTALVYPPNNFDGMTYHLPRVMHWIQNCSVFYYPTSIDRQIGMAPLNSLISLQSIILGNDYFVNLTQFLSFLGFVFGVKCITKFLDGKRIAQYAAMFFAITLPTAILQASNVDSCNLVTFWICGFVFFFLKWYRKKIFKDILLLSFCLAFAILSKGSSYPIALPFVIVIAFICIYNYKNLLIHGIIAASLIIFINLPHYVNSYHGLGSIFGSSQINMIHNPNLSKLTLSLFQNFALHETFILKYGGVTIFNKFKKTFDVADSDIYVFPSVNISSCQVKYRTSDTFAQNFIHAILVLLLIFLFRFYNPSKLYFSIVTFSLISFCFFLSLHPWATRIHTTLFILFAPLFGLFFQKSALNKKLKRSLIYLLCFFSIFPLFFCQERPLYPFDGYASFDLIRENTKYFLTDLRDDLYFNAEPEILNDYKNGIDFLIKNKITHFAVDLGGNGWEYPLWTIIKNKTGKMPHIEHIQSFTGHIENIPSYIFVQNSENGQNLEYPHLVDKNYFITHYTKQE